MAGMEPEPVKRIGRVITCLRIDTLKLQLGLELTAGAFELFSELMPDIDLDFDELDTDLECWHTDTVLE